MALHLSKDVTAVEPLARGTEPGYRHPVAPMRRKRKRDARAKASGYTLIELLVSMLLLAFGVLSAAPLFMYSIQGNSSGAALGNVAAAAEERLETLRGDFYGNLVVGGSLVSNTAGYFDYPEPDVLVRWEIAANAIPPGTKRISVRGMHVRNGPGPALTLDLITLRGD